MCLWTQNENFDYVQDIVLQNVSQTYAHIFYTQVFKRLCFEFKDILSDCTLRTTQRKLSRCSARRRMAIVAHLGGDSVPT